MRIATQRWINNFIDILFPRVCTVCHKPLVEGEDIMCIGCLVELPRINHKDFADNNLTERLASLKAPLTKATSMFHYVSGNPYSKLIHDTKYNRRPIVGHKLAKTHASELQADGFFNDIDVILPIPLHFTKLWRRGYNQSLEIAKGISSATDIPIGDNLVATRPHATQTRKNAGQRMANTRNTFSVNNPEELDGLHILVVDDVITTGSTILSALETIHKSTTGTRLSVYSLGMTLFSAT